MKLLFILHSNMGFNIIIGSCDRDPLRSLIWFILVLKKFVLVKSFWGGSIILYIHMFLISKNSLLRLSKRRSLNVEGNSLGLNINSQIIIINISCKCIDIFSSSLVDFIKILREIIKPIYERVNIVVNMTKYLLIIEYIYISILIL